MRQNAPGIEGVLSLTVHRLSITHDGRGEQIRVAESHVLVVSCVKQLRIDETGG